MGAITTCFAAALVPLKRRSSMRRTRTRRESPCTPPDRECDEAVQITLGHPFVLSAPMIMFRRNKNKLQYSTIQYVATFQYT